MKMLIVITDMHNPLAIFTLPDGLEVEMLREEYESIMDPGPNPFCYETDEPRQHDWIERVRKREHFLTTKYGGDGETVYSPVTFANWLVREKGAIPHAFGQYCMAEFD